MENDERADDAKLVFAVRRPSFDILHSELIKILYS